MTYVPGFTHDIFLSYAHGDSKEWIRALEESLRQQLRERLGVDVRIWQDANNIRCGQAWPDEIQQGVLGAAAFLAVLSPSYQNSDWCAKERRIFLDHCKASQSLKAGSYYRFLKLLKMPWPDDGHEEFHQEFQYVSFFERRPASEEDDPSS